MCCTDKRARAADDEQLGDAALADPLRRRLTALGSAGLVGLIAVPVVLPGCGVPRRGPPPDSPPQQPRGEAVPPSAPAARPARAQPPRPARNWAEYRVQAGQRLVQMNPGRIYLSTPPEPLLAIPVLEIELYVDGSVSSISVQRRPRQALDTVQLAIEAVRRAAPFAPVGHLPRPWKFTEVFLFDDNRLFKPMSLE